jgi:hypothetical protein
VPSAIHGTRLSLDKTHILSPLYHADADVNEDSVTYEHRSRRRRRASR